MHLSDSAKLLRQRAVAVALLLSAVFAVAAITVSVLAAGSGSAHHASLSGPAATAVRGLMFLVQMLFGAGGHWG